MTELKRAEQLCLEAFADAKTMAALIQEHLPEMTAHCPTIMSLARLDAIPPHLNDDFDLDAFVAECGIIQRAIEHEF